MNDKLKKQMMRVHLLSEMADEELAKYLEYSEQIKKWREITPLDWKSKPNFLPKKPLQRAMMTLRQEMIKLDKML